MYCHHERVGRRRRSGGGGAVGGGSVARQCTNRLMLRESFHPAPPSKGVLSSNSSRARAVWCGVCVLISWGADAPRSATAAHGRLKAHLGAWEGREGGGGASDLLSFE